MPLAVQPAHSQSEEPQFGSPMSRTDLQDHPGRHLGHLFTVITPGPGTFGIAFHGHFDGDGQAAQYLEVEGVYRVVFGDFATDSVAGSRSEVRFNEVFGICL